MKSKILSVAVTIIIIFLLSGCIVLIKKASPKDDVIAKKLTAPEGKALVYVIRPSMFGSAMNIPVICDDRYLGNTGGGMFIYAFLDPGTHHFASLAETRTDFALEVKASEVYYIKVSPQPGWFHGRSKLQNLALEDGKLALQNTTLSTECVAFPK